MGGFRMKIGVLTSSRADFGIYRPLLERWKNDSEISFEIIAFGQHLLDSFGNTVEEIEREGFKVEHRIYSNYIDDSPHGIALSYASVHNKFVSFWNENLFDCVLVLGDRYEMAAAVQAGIPFRVKFAHIHAGEKTMGAIDEIYRHQISLAAELHFVSLAEYAKRVHELIGKKETTFVTGAIGLENLRKIKLLNINEFQLKWGIDLTIPTLFFIVHPETKDFETNQSIALVLKEVTLELSSEFQIVVSLPNSDTNSSILRDMWKEVHLTNPKIKLIEHFGTQSFFTCMNLCHLIIGNSSSAILEAASFKKYALNLGSRQLGRISGENVIDMPFNVAEILAQVHKYKNQDFLGKNIYEQKDGVTIISERIKQFNL
jgi:GDP/UDP-N,N'-diacetylbacillosamine 2-epimerase (hydrolysing)